MERIGKRKFTFKEQRDFDAIEERIATMEEELANIQQAIEANSSDYQKVSQLMEQQSALEKELEAAMDRWVELQEIFEEIQNQN